MSSWNLALRFGLELACLTGIGIAGWLVSPLVAVAGVVVAAAAWGIFAVPGDPSRSGNAPVVVPGWLRLFLELTVFLGGASAWAAASLPEVATAILLLLVVHHAAAQRRLVWLLRQRATWDVRISLRNWMSAVPVPRSIASSWNVRRTARMQRSSSH